MMNKKLVSGFAAFAISLFLFSCSKDNGDPSIKFVTGHDFTGKDTIMMVGDTLPVTVKVTWNGTDVLDNLDIRCNGTSVGNATVDETEATFTINLIKSALETEVWSFVIVDKKDNKAQLDLTLTKDPNSIYGPVSSLSAVLGAPVNTSQPGFLSLQTRQYFSLDNAFLNQNLVDLLFYFDQNTQSTLAGPGSEIPAGLYSGYKDVTAWSVRNVTSFMKVNWTADYFSAITTDAPLLNNWKDELSSTTAKNLAVNDVWLFKLKSGKLGVLLIKTIVAGTDGLIEFDLKMQQ